MIQVLFWLGVLLIVMGGLSLIVTGNGNVLAGLAAIVFGPFVWRIYCEILIVIFSINDTLTEIRNLKSRGA